MREALVRDLAPPGADLRADLGLHQLRGDHRHRLPQNVAVLIEQRPADESWIIILCLSAIVVFLSSVDLVVNRRVEGPAMAGAAPDPVLCAVPLDHFYRHDQSIDWWARSARCDRRAQATVDEPDHA